MYPLVVPNRIGIGLIPAVYKLMIFPGTICDFVVSTLRVARRWLERAPVQTSQAFVRKTLGLVVTWKACFVVMCRKGRKCDVFRGCSRRKGEWGCFAIAGKGGWNLSPGREVSERQVSLLPLQQMQIAGWQSDCNPLLLAHVSI